MEIFKGVSGIYSITNKLNNKKYIGSSKNVHIRFNSHRNDLNQNKHYNGHLQNSWNKYGEDNFVFNLIEKFNDLDNLFIAEQKWIEYYKSFIDDYGYNMRPASKSSCFGFKHSLETKKKHSERSKGESNGNSVLTEENVPIIRLLSKDEGITSSSLARYYKVGNSAVARIISNESWKGVQPACLSDDKILELKKDIFKNQSNSRVISNEGIKNIKLMLRDTELLMNEIASIFNIDYMVVKYIKKGITGKYIFVSDEDILDLNYNSLAEKIIMSRRKISLKKALEIKLLIVYSNLSLTEICEIYNIKSCVITRIKQNSHYQSGKIEKNLPDYLTLPNHLYKKAENKIKERVSFIGFLTYGQVMEIKDILRNSLIPMKQIAEKMSISESTINRINNGISFTEVLKTEKPIIRKKKYEKSKLNEGIVIEIKKLLNNGELSQKEIANMYNIAKSTVGNIKYGVTWSHVEI